MSAVRRFLPLVLLVGPSVLVLGVLALYPILRVLVDSFFNVDYASGQRAFTGLANYRAVLADSEFSASFFNTLQFTVVASVSEVVLGGALALLFFVRFVAAASSYRSSFCR